MHFFDEQPTTESFSPSLVHPRISDLSEIGLTALPADAFAGLPSLTEL